MYAIFLFLNVESVFVEIPFAEAMLTFFASFTQYIDEIFVRLENLSREISRMLFARFLRSRV